MKTMNLLKLTAAALLLVSGAASAQIANTAHDLSGASGDDGRVCVYCHTPHNASAAVPSPPLWNKVLTATNFTIYASSTIDNNTGQPEGTSLACLTCHDGTLAIDAMINPPKNYSGNQGTIGGGANLGSDLSNDHPISIGYDTALDADFVAPATVVGTLPLFAGTQDATYQVECASCHNVHDDTIQPFMRISNVNSALCNTCHVK